jgi:hypothetical protein
VTENTNLDQENVYCDQDNANDQTQKKAELSQTRNSRDPGFISPIVTSPVSSNIYNRMEKQHGKSNELVRRTLDQSENTIIIDFKENV